jgi:hypothetical protein
MASILLAVCAFVLLLTVGALGIEEYAVNTLDVTTGLLSNVQIEFFHYALRKDGLVSFVGFPGLSEARQRAFKILAECYQENKLTADGTLSVQLSDGTVRVTLALESRVNLDEGHFASCQGLATELNTLRDLVTKAGRIFATALDGFVKPKGEPMFMAANNPTTQDYRSFESIIEGGTHLDHLHIYDKRNAKVGQDQETALGRHTDQGLFVAIVPSISFLDDGRQMSPGADGFEVEIAGEMRRLALQQNSILFMLGDGIKNWMGHVNAIQELRVVPHRLIMAKQNMVRVWLGRMFFLPKDAFIPSAAKRFDEVMAATLAKVSSGLDYAGCSTGGEALSDLTGVACDKDEIYCWMACRSTRDLHCSSTQKPECVNQETGQTWTDDSKHCFECAASCYPTESPSDNSTDASYGGVCNTRLYPTSMYMEGFTGINIRGACLVFLFQGWVLDTTFKYILGCAASFAIGFATEWFIYARREMRKPCGQRASNILRRLPQPAGTRQHSAVLLALYFIQLILAYSAMLLAMSFAFLIFGFVLLGLAAGHWVYNFEQVPTSAEACCAAGEMNEALGENPSLESSIDSASQQPLL